MHTIPKVAPMRLLALILVTLSEKRGNFVQNVKVVMSL